jgi:hypothetical protein
VECNSELIRYNNYLTKQAYDITINAIFHNPVPNNLEWRRIESLLKAVGAKVIEGSGSRVKFDLNGVVATFHRPHPQKKPNPTKYVMRSIS